MHHDDAAPVGGPIFTRTFQVLLGLAIAAGILVAWRFLVGLGPSTGMTDSYPWGVWKLFNVIVLTSVASGGYAMALLVYVVNKGHYHPLVRHALLTSAVGYSVAVIALAVDVGKPLNFWKVPTFTWAWNIDSVLLEVALCVSAYLLVLWLELSPVFLKKIEELDWPAVASFARKFGAGLDKVFVWIIGLGILLPTMHQSSLGSLYLLAGDKLHAFWQTPLLPLLFLLSCWIMGFAAVILTYVFASVRYRRDPALPLMRPLARVVAGIMGAFVLVRIGDLIYRGQIGALLQGDRYTAMVLIELALFSLPAFMIFKNWNTVNLGQLVRYSAIVLIGGGMYRLDSTWFAYRPGDGFTYFPSTPEVLITLGFIACQALVYMIIVKRFPVLTPNAAPVRRPVMPSLDEAIPVESKATR